MKLFSSPGAAAAAASSLLLLLGSIPSVQSAPWFGRSDPSSNEKNKVSTPVTAPVDNNNNDNNDNNNNKVITDFVLVNAATGVDILLLESGMTIDTSMYGTLLSIRVETVASYSNINTNNFVQMDLDEGVLRRVEPKAPYYLAGNSDDDATANEIYPSYTMAKPGHHSLTACPNDSALYSHDIAVSSNSNSNSNHATAGGRRTLANHPDCATITWITVQGGKSSGSSGGSKAASSSATATSTTTTTLHTHTVSATPDLDETSEPIYPTAPTDVPHSVADAYGIINTPYSNGNVIELSTKVVLALSGPPASETGMTIPGAYRAPSTFADYKLECHFTFATNTDTMDVETVTVPGYYAGNGQGANQGSTHGNHWQCAYIPNRVGLYTWTTTYTQGTNVAQNGGGNPGGFFDGASGSFQVVTAAADDKNKLFGASITAVPKTATTDAHFVVQNNQYNTLAQQRWIRWGPQSPVNFLEYADFDDAKTDAKTYAAHASDYNMDAPVIANSTFGNGRGKNLLGALKHLQEQQGVNGITVTTYDSTHNVFPWLHSSDNTFQYDLSKLDQWTIVLDAAKRLGLHITISLESNDGDDNVNGNLNFGQLFEERKLYYREMVARFGHVKCTWELGLDLTVSQIIERSAYIRATDPYRNPIAVRISTTSNKNKQHELWTMDKIPALDSVALVTLDGSDGAVVKDILAWRAATDYVITSAAQGPIPTGGVLPDSEYTAMDAARASVRANAVWGPLLAGSSGMAYMFGTSYAESDSSLQDFRSRQEFWKEGEIAMSLMESVFLTQGTTVASSSYQMNNALVPAGHYCTVSANTMVIYRPAAATTTTVTTDRDYTVAWYNPRTGGNLVARRRVAAGTDVSVGAPPTEATLDWVVVLTAVE